MFLGPLTKVRNVQTLHIAALCTISDVSSTDKGLMCKASFICIVWGSHRIGDYLIEGARFNCKSHFQIVAVLENLVIKTRIIPSGLYGGAECLILYRITWFLLINHDI